MIQVLIKVTDSMKIFLQMELQFSPVLFVWCVYPEHLRQQWGWMFSPCVRGKREQFHHPPKQL